VRLSKQVSGCTFAEDCEGCAFLAFCKHWSGEQTSDEQEQYYLEVETGRQAARVPARDRDQMMMEV